MYNVMCFIVRRKYDQQPAPPGLAWALLSRDGVARGHTDPVVADVLPDTFAVRGAPPPADAAHAVHAGPAPIAAGRHLRGRIVPQG